MSRALHSHDHQSALSATLLLGFALFRSAPISGTSVSILAYSLPHTCLQLLQWRAEANTQTLLHLCPSRTPITVSNRGRSIKDVWLGERRSAVVCIPPPFNHTGEKKAILPNADWVSVKGLSTCGPYTQSHTVHTHTNILTSSSDVHNHSCGTRVRRGKMPSLTVKEISWTLQGGDLQRWSGYGTQREGQFPPRQIVFNFLSSPPSLPVGWACLEHSGSL